MQKMLPGCGTTPQPSSSVGVAPATAPGTAAEAISFSSTEKSLTVEAVSSRAGTAAEVPAGSPLSGVLVAGGLAAVEAAAKGAPAAATEATAAAVEDGPGTSLETNETVAGVAAAAADADTEGNSAPQNADWGSPKGPLGPIGSSRVSCPLPLSAAVMGAPWAPPGNMNIWHSPSLSPVEAFIKSGEESPGVPPEEALARPPFGGPRGLSEETRKGLSEETPEISSGAPYEDGPVDTSWGQRDAASGAPSAEAPRGPHEEGAPEEGPGEGAAGGYVEDRANAFLEWCSAEESVGSRGYSGGRGDGWGTRKQLLEGLAERCHRQHLELQQQQQALLEAEQRHQQQEEPQRTSSDSPQQQTPALQEMPRAQLLQQMQATPTQARQHEQQELTQQDKQLPPQRHQQAEQLRHTQKQEDQGQDQQQQPGQQQKRFNRRLSRNLRCMPSLVEAFLVLGPPAASPVLDCCIGRYCQQQQKQLCYCCCCRQGGTVQAENTSPAATAVVAAGEGTHDNFAPEHAVVKQEMEQQQQQQHQQRQKLLRRGSSRNDNVEHTSSSTSSVNSSSSDLLQPHVWWCCTCKSTPCVFPEGAVPPESSRSRSSSRNRSSCATSFCSSSRAQSLCSRSQRCPSGAASAVEGSNSCSSSSSSSKDALSVPARRRCSSSCPSYSNRGTSSRRTNSCSLPGSNFSKDHGLLPANFSGSSCPSRHLSSSRGSSENRKRTPHSHATRAPTAARLCVPQSNTADVGHRSSGCCYISSSCYCCSSNNYCSSSNDCSGGSCRRSCSDTPSRCQEEGTRRRSSSWPLSHTRSSVAVSAVIAAGAGAAATSAPTDAAAAYRAAAVAAIPADGVDAVAPASEAADEPNCHSPAEIRCRVRGVCSCSGGGSSTSSSCCSNKSSDPPCCCKCNYTPSFDVAVTRKGKPKVLPVPEPSSAATTAADPATIAAGPEKAVGAPAADAVEEPAAADPGVETGEGCGGTSWLPPEVPPAAELFCFPQGTAKVLPVSSGRLCTLLRPQQKQQPHEDVAVARPCTSPWQSYVPPVLTELLSPGVYKPATNPAAASPSVLEVTPTVSSQMFPEPAATLAAGAAAAASAAPTPPVSAADRPCMCQWGGCPCASLLRVHSPSSSVFVLTDIQGRRLYGHCLRFFELVAFRVPGSSNGMLSSSRRSAVNSAAAEGEAVVDTVAAGREQETGKICGEEDVACTAAATAGCCSSEPPLAYVERAFCLLSELPFFGVFHEWLWCTYTSYAALCQATACSARGHIVLQKQQQVEQRVLLPSPLLYLQQQATRLVEETPAPVAAHIWEVFPLQIVQMRCEGNSSNTDDHSTAASSNNYSSNNHMKKLQVSVSIECTRALHFALPPPGSLPLLQLPVVNLLKAFPLELLLLLFLLLLCEKQIVLLSASVNRLSLLPCALTALMYPLRYSQVFVPLLPTSLAHFVSMPLPFCVGFLTPPPPPQQKGIPAELQPQVKYSSSNCHRKRSGIPRGRAAPPAVYMCTVPDFTAAAATAAAAATGTVPSSSGSNTTNNCTNTISGNMLYAINLFSQALDTFPLGVYLVDLDSCSLTLSHVALATAAADPQQRDYLDPLAAAAATATAAEAAATAAAPGTVAWGLPPLPDIMLRKLVASLVPLLCKDAVAAAAAAAAAAAIVDGNLTSQQRKMLQRHQQKQHKKRRQQQQQQIPSFLPSNWLLLRENVTAAITEEAAAYSARLATSAAAELGSMGNNATGSKTLQPQQNASKGDPLQLLRTSSKSQHQQQQVLSPQTRGQSSNSFGTATAAGATGVATAGSSRSGNTSANLRGGANRSHSGALLSVFRFLNLLPPGRTEQQQLHQRELQHLPQPAKLQLQQQQQHRRDNWLWRLWGQRSSASGADMTDTAAAASASAAATAVAAAEDTAPSLRGGPGQPAVFRYSSVPVGVHAAAADAASWMREKQQQQRNDKQQLEQEEEQQRQEDRPPCEDPELPSPSRDSCVSPARAAAVSETESAGAVDASEVGHSQQQQPFASSSNHGRRGVSLLFQRQCRSSSEVFERSRTWVKAKRPSAAAARGVTPGTTAAAAPAVAAAALVSVVNGRDESWGPGNAISSAPATFVADAGLQDGAAAVAAAATEPSCNLLPVWREFSGVSFESSEEGDSLNLPVVYPSSQEAALPTAATAAVPISSSLGGPSNPKQALLCEAGATAEPAKTAEAEAAAAAAAAASRMAALQQASTVCSQPHIDPLDGTENPLTIMREWSSTLAIGGCCQQQQELQQQHTQQKQANAVADSILREVFLRFFVDLLRGCTVITRSRYDAPLGHPCGGPYKGKETPGSGGRQRGQGASTDEGPLLEEICSTQAFASFLQVQDEARAMELVGGPPERVGPLLPRADAQQRPERASIQDPQVGALSPRSRRAVRKAAAAAALYCKPFWVLEAEDKLQRTCSNSSRHSGSHLAATSPPASQSGSAEALVQQEPQTAGSAASQHLRGSSVPWGVKYTVPVRSYTASAAALCCTSSDNTYRVMGEDVAVLLRPRWPLSWPSASLRAARKNVSSGYGKCSRSSESTSSNRSSSNNGSEGKRET